MTRLHVSLRGASRRFAEHLVLEGVDLDAAAGERIAVIGDNGAGKSTLLRLISGELAPDAGEVRVTAPGGVSVLPQALDLPVQATVADAIDACWPELRRLEHALDEAARDLGGLREAALVAALEHYARLVARYESLDGYGAPARLAEAAHALGVGAVAHDRAWRTLSGGERARLVLAAAIASNAELLLLDEPSNDLDDACWEWLVERLRRHRGTVIVVSHDRAFVERLTEVVWEVEGRGVRRFGGGYAGYLAAKAAERERQRLAHEAWTAELERRRALIVANAGRLDAIPRKLDKAGMGTGAFRPRGRDHGAMGRIRNAKQRVARLLDEPVAPPPEPLRFTPALQAASPTAGDPATTGATPDGRGGPVPEAPGPLLALRRIALHGVPLPDVELGAGGRLLVTGPNGAGKSTLLHAIAGRASAASEGRVPVSGGIELRGALGFLRQHAAPVATPRRRLLAAYAAGLREDEESAAERLRGLGLFRPEEFDRPLGGLSYGQRRRLELALLVSRPVDVLLLDEPSNHLAPALADELEQAIGAFAGAVVLVTHDRRARERFVGGATVELALGAPARVPIV